MPIENFDVIRDLNDEFRLGCRDVDHQVLWPPALMDRGLREAVLKAIREQTDFAHDPFRLHDHGTVIVEGKTIEWSIAYLTYKSTVTSPELAERRALMVW